MKIKDLRDMPEDRLIAWHDISMKDRAPHYNVFLDELARREAVRQGERMEKLTRSLNLLTWVILAATVVGVVLTAVSLLGA